MLNKEYLIQKNEALSGRVTKNLFPYLFDYYTGSHKNPIIKKYTDFSTMFEAYLNTPIQYPDGSMEEPIVGLVSRFNEIFNYLDKKYTEDE